MRFFLCHEFRHNRCCLILYSGTRPLHWAAHRGRVAIAEMLIDKRADVNARDSGCAVLPSYRIHDMWISHKHCQWQHTFAFGDIARSSRHGLLPSRSWCGCKRSRKNGVGFDMHSLTLVSYYMFPSVAATLRCIAQRLKDTSSSRSSCFYTAPALTVKISSEFPC